MIRYCIPAFLLLLTINSAVGQIDPGRSMFDDRFRQLEEILPTPNAYRTASGAPSRLYWQQQVDYQIEVTLDDENQSLSGSEVITYTNNSPDILAYLWVQLDQNRHRADSSASLTRSPRSEDRISYAGIRAEFERDFGGGYNIRSVKSAKGTDLSYTIVDTMMRIDMPRPLHSGQSFIFSIDWDYRIINAKWFRARSGYEFFENDGNYIYVMAQWFPRLAAYTDSGGWNTKQFLGAGEFTLEFGNYHVEITVPDDHIVSATGQLQNPSAVLSSKQRRLLAQAENADKPIFIVTPEEAKANESSTPSGTSTWIFRARDVRDFAFASSRKFIWDAQGHKQRGGNDVMAMSFYPKEGNPLWERYSTHAIIHTLEVYSRFTFDYPYPVAQSVNGPVGGMEYPMISFNGPRPDERDEKERMEKDDPENEAAEEDGVEDNSEEAEEERTYSRGTKYALISVIIHEIGHNYFPMIVNSDERQWTWMDEGLNTFLQFIAEQEWEQDYPSRRGEPRKIKDYMRSKRQVPIMTQSDSVLDLGNNAYAKPATALVVLRETVLGRELFDFAFKEYAERWKFKHPTPADFFRTMEDASGVDLDWFWRGWFYTTDHVDISVDKVIRYTLDSKDPDMEQPKKREEKTNEPLSLTQQRDVDVERRIDRFPQLADFYNENDEFTVSNKDRNKYEKLIEGLEQWERDMLSKTENFYFIEFSNKGGLVMPIILAISYDDGSEEEIRIPAEIWRRDPGTATKLLMRNKLISSIVVDPHWETADVDIENNYFPRRVVPSRLEVFKFEREKHRNLMKDMRVKLKTDDEDGRFKKTHPEGVEPASATNPGASDEAAEN